MNRRLQLKIGSSLLVATLLCFGCQSIGHTSNGNNSGAKKHTDTDQVPLTFHTFVEPPPKVTFPIGIAVDSHVEPPPKVNLPIGIAVDSHVEPPSKVTLPIGIAVDSQGVVQKTEIPLEVRVKTSEPDPVDVAVNFNTGGKLTNSIDVPMNVRLAESSTNQIPVALSMGITTNSPPSISIPIALTAHGNGGPPIKIPVAFTPSNSGGPLQLKYPPGYENGKISDGIQRLQFWTLVLIVLISGIMGALIRFFEYRREEMVRRAEAKSSDSKPQELDAIDATYSGIFIDCFLWGVASSALVPATLASVNSAIVSLEGVTSSGALQLIGFCIVAGYLGPVFFGRAVNRLRRALVGQENERNR